MSTQDPNQPPDPKPDETGFALPPGFDTPDTADLVRRAQEHGLILRAMAGDAIAFCPPLIITETQIAEMIRRFANALEDTQNWLKS